MNPVSRALCAIFPCLSLFASAADWQDLFNGKDLSGWKIECREPDRAKTFWKASDGSLECNTAGDRKHDYVWLVSEREFGDFEFECVVHSFAGSTGNSGVQVRSRFQPDASGGGWMHGPQIDIHPPSPFRCGWIYDETAETKRWISPSLTNWQMDPDQGTQNPQWSHLNAATTPAPPGNTLRIVARGSRIETWVNGKAVARFDGTGILDDEAHQRHQVGLRGHLALQLHAGDDLHIRFSKLRIRELDPPTEPSPVTVVRTDTQLKATLATLRPGSVVRLAPGTYQPGLSVQNVHGTADQPIVIEALDPRQPPLFEGGSQAWHFSGVSHLTLRWLHFRGQKANGINLDDGGNFTTPSHHILLENLLIEDTGPQGNFDAIKCSGLVDFKIDRCRISGWGGQAIDFVGCHRAEIARCTITGKPGFSQHTGPQFKGGSSDVWLHHCRFENAGGRPIQAGGSTGLAYFRPADASFEAARIRIEDNTILGGECAVAFTGVRDATFTGNTIVGPGKWIMRILQESRDVRFARCGNVEFARNTIVFDRANIREAANIGPDTEPQTFRFVANRWFARDDPARSALPLPTPEKDGVYGVKPLNVLPIESRTVREVPMEKVKGPRAVISVNADGEVTLDGLKVPEGLLEPYLAAYQKQNPGRKLELEADRNLPLERLTAIWDSMLKAGVQVKEVPARIRLPEQ